jgi:cytochrome c-type biogenesis protein CcmH/NrfG
MKTSFAAALAVGCLVLGMGVGFAARQKAPPEPGIEVMRGKPPKEAGLAALAEAEKLAGTNSWEVLACARVYYLSGDKARGQALIDGVVSRKAETSDWLRIGEIYAQAGENARAEEAYGKAIAGDPKDDSGHAEIGAWYIRIGQRDKGEELFAQAFAQNPEDVWHYTRAAEALLGVPPGR